MVVVITVPAQAVTAVVTVARTAAAAGLAEATKYLITLQ
jgi:hypothetical protein